MQVYDVRLAELRQAGDVGATVCHIYSKQILSAETIALPDGEPLPQEIPP